MKNQFNSPIYWPKDLRSFKVYLSGFRSVLSIVILLATIDIVSGQSCPVTPCNSPHRTFVNLAIVPECGTGSTNLDGDVQSNQQDCKSSGLNCHEFIIYRAPNSLTQQFTLHVGQGSGCTGELDASYAYINGVCYQLSNGGSGTVITFSFPFGTDTIHLFFCINSGAHISICNLCKEPPPCTQLPLCNLSNIDISGCQSDIPPAATNPANVFTNTGTCSALVMDHVDVGDTVFCGSPPAVNFTRTYSLYFIDSNGDTIKFRECTQIIHVVSPTPVPVISCPANVTIECNASTAPVNTGGPATATDNCGGSPTLMYSDISIASMGCPHDYTLHRTWTATSVCGNTSTCSQVIIIKDNTGPQITCPSNVTVQCANQIPPSNPASVTATDNCGGLSTITFEGEVISNQICVNRFTLTRTYRATDICGNSSSCNQTITVFDNIPPSITCPSDVTVQCAELVPVQNTAGISTSDNCGEQATVAYVGDVISNQTCANRFNITRTYRAIDVCGNSATCNQTITVFDNTPPVCMTHDITISINEQIGHTDVTPVQIDNGSNDNCGPVTLNLSPNSFTCMNVGMNIVTLTVTDLCNNTSTCTATITVSDCFNPCVTIIACVYLEGAAASPTGGPNYSIPMRTSLNNLRVLPGQTYLDPFLGTPHYTPPGEPYCAAPWNYCGTEGNIFDSFGVPGTAGYPPTAVDWVLVSVRADSAGTGGPLCEAAALLHNDGHIEFVQPFDCCDLNLFGSYYLVVEHRNHLIVMSQAKVPIVPGLTLSTLTYSFCTQQSYEDPQFAGLDIFAREKEILSGSFAMYSGNGEQSNSGNSDTEINVNDLSTWLNQNGTIGAYRLGDYNLNGDTNLNDRTTWEHNNGRSTSVPR